MVHSFLKLNVSYKVLREGVKSGTNYVMAGSRYILDSPGIHPNSKFHLPLGVYTTKKCVKNEILYKLHGDLHLNPTNKTIHIGNGMHIDDKDFGRYINHSFEPNIKIVHNHVVAFRDICIGEELMYNYNDSEQMLVKKFTVGGAKVTGNPTL